MSLFELGGLTLDRVELDLTALDKLAGCIPLQGGESLLLVDIGLERSNLVWRTGETLLALRSLPAGLGRRDRQPPGSEQGSDVAEPPVSDTSGGEAAKGSAKEAENLIRQIRITLLAAEGGHQAGGLVLTGDSRDLESVEHVLQEQAGLALSSLETVLQEGGNGQGIPVEAAAAAAAALYRPGRKEEFNLARDPEQEDALSRWKPHLRFAVPALCLLALSWSVMFGTDLYLQHKRCTDLNNRLSATFEQIVPDAGANIRPVQYASVIRSRIRAAGSADPLQELTRVKLTRILETMSRVLSPELEFQAGLLALDHSTLRLSGLANDFKTVDALSSQLEGSELFTGVTIVGANLDQGGEQVSFSLELQIRAGSGSN